MLYPDLARHQMEEKLEADLLAVALTMIPNVPAKEDLKVARSYFPGYFGGAFPTLGLAVERTEGGSRYADKRRRPGLLRGRIVLYQPCMPVRGAASKQDDRTGEAKRITRRLRGQFLEKVYASKLGSHFEVVESRGGSSDEIGNSISEETGRNILYLDRTEFEVTV